MRCQRVLFSAYRTDQYADPDGFLTSLGAVLEQYPNEVIVYVTDPRTGIQRGQKFPPTIAEIVAACDGRVSDLRRQDRFRNWGKPDEETPLLDGPREKRMTLEEMKARYGENWGMTSLNEPDRPAKRAPTKEELVAHYRDYDLEFRPKESA